MQSRKLMSKMLAAIHVLVKLFKMEGFAKP
jgi:hypothetical protein